MLNVKCKAVETKLEAKDNSNNKKTEDMAEEVDRFFGWAIFIVEWQLKTDLRKSSNGDWQTEPDDVQKKMLFIDTMKMFHNDAIGKNLMMRFVRTIFLNW